QRHDERVFPADLVAEPAEEERPERPDEEADREDRHRAEEGGDRVALLEELHREDRGQAAEDIKVVPLDDVADRCCDDDAAELFGLYVRCRHGPPLFVGLSGRDWSPQPPWLEDPNCSAVRHGVIQDGRRRIYLIALRAAQPPAVRATPAPRGRRRATPVLMAASATAVATAGTSRASNIDGVMYSSDNSLLATIPA